MRIFRVNILSKNVLKTADTICFTSNGIIKRDGRLVMGAGVAKQFRDTFHDLDQQAGTAVKQYGHICQVVRQTIYLGNSLNIVSFPTKYNWKNKSDIKLIERSAIQLVELTDRLIWKKIYLPFPGINNGGLDKEFVTNAINKIFDDRFIICYL